MSIYVYKRMAENPMVLPGMTEYPEKYQLSMKPYTSLTNPGERKTIILTGSKISSGTLFNNGLIQNVYVLYKMFESMGWTSIIITDSLPESLENIPKFMHTLRMLTLESFVKAGFQDIAMLYISPLPLRPHLQS